MVRSPRCAQSSGTDTVAHSSCVPQPVQLIAGGGAERSEASAAAVTGARTATAVPAARTVTARARPRWNRPVRDAAVLFGVELSNGARSSRRRRAGEVQMPRLAASLAHLTYFHQRTRPMCRGDVSGVEI